LAEQDALIAALQHSAAVEDTTDAVDHIAQRIMDALNTPPRGKTPRRETPADDRLEASQSSHGEMVWPPAQLGHFRILREIGHGGMGYVYEAEDEKLTRQVAVKVLRPDRTRRVGAAERFLGEARAAAKVEHDCVVPILHMGEDAGLLYLVMPLLKGETLENQLKRGRLSIAEALRFGTHIAMGLMAIHTAGLVHRDIKPANVWLDVSGQARILDFGLARHYDDNDTSSVTGTLQGTPAYMAPEQIEGAAASVRSDLFAFGAILYECVTGHRAFPGATINAILKAVATYNPPSVALLNPDVPRELADLITRLLAKTPELRPNSAAEVVTALAHISIGNGDTIQTWVDSTRLVSRKRRVWQLAGLAATLLVSTAGVWWATRPSPEGSPTGNNTLPFVPVPPPHNELIHHRGHVDVLVERVVAGQPRLLRLNEPDALPLRPNDKFRIECEVNPAAYVYVIWIDPEHDITPVYPWNAAQGWGSRPSTEQPVTKVSLPPNAGNRYTAPHAKPGVATIVLLATASPMREPDDVVEQWFTPLPELPLPAGGNHVAVWFDNFLEVKDPLRLRTFGEVGSDDAFARWQGQLQRALGTKVHFQSAVSFARTGTDP
jgi:serine/threonine protein kinase